ncbi:MAG: primosomal protein N' [Dehalococcoidia bacterium]
MFAEVAVDFPDTHARTFTYLAPPGMAVVPGDLVWVPFGPRTIQGVVFGLVEQSPVEETRPIMQRVVDGPFISPQRLAVARWIAEHYRSTLYAACSMMLPSGSQTRLRHWITRARAPEAATGDLKPRDLRALEYASADRRIRKDRLARRLGRGGAAVVDRLVRRGYLAATAEWERPRISAQYLDIVVLAVPAEQARAEADDHRGGRSQRRAELLDWLATDPPGETRSRLAKRFGPAAVKAVLDSGLARLERVHMDRDPLRHYAVQQQFPFEPTPAQAGAIEAIVAAVTATEASADPARFLLFGITGSGKTEVYLQAAEACVAAGKRVLVLVPEIALTPQTLRRFASRFPGKVALLHSGLSDGERFDQWWRVRGGDYPVVLGSRGAVFAPIDNLGLVVIDEEHEWTYKQHDQSPRYHARDVAEQLCRETGAALVAGSATPDLITFRRTERGEYRLLRLPRRTTPGSLSETDPASIGHAGVRIIDMRDELRAGHIHMLSRPLIDGMRDSLNAGGRVILFMNRRGAASFVQCRDCGAVRGCRRCDTSLTYHNASGDGSPARLVCHYCNYSVQAGRACPACGGAQVRRMSPGTQAVADAVLDYFPRVNVIRWDSDAARTAKDHIDIMERFESGESTVLVGTQMVAKGLDIPAVTLVGVVSADTGLAVPDFRAGERAFQVLAQVAGRAGRGRQGGQVLMQTFQPEHYVIRAAALQDYEAFYRTEIELRSRYASPPFTRLIRLMYTDPDPVEAQGTAVEAAKAFRHEQSVSGETSVEVIGPTPAFPLRVRGMYRWHIVLKGPRPEALLDMAPVGRGWITDVDPVSLL